MIGYDVRFCDYCQCSIVAGQRWVREKLYDPRSTDRDAAYRHFHAEVFGGEEVSCWEKYWMEREVARRCRPHVMPGKLALQAAWQAFGGT
jgi:hypothetical protein